MIDFKFQIGEDSFGLYIQTDSYNDLDELDDFLVEKYSLIPIGTIDPRPDSENDFRLYFIKGIGLAKLTTLMNSATLPVSSSGT